MFNRMHTNSRLSRNQENRSKHMLYVTIAGIVLILLFFLKFGVPLLINFALFVGGKGQPGQIQPDSNITYVAAPVLNPTFTATNSAQISISGIASNNEIIDLYVNGNKTVSKETKSDGSFKFDNVSLQTGDNEIKAKAVVNKKESDFSEAVTITYKNTPVSLTVDNPHDGDSFSKDQNSVVVSGKTDPDAKVTVNDFWAIVDSSGNYSYDLHLNNGDNPIKVIATDPAGNKTENDLKVTYSQ